MCRAHVKWGKKKVVLFSVHKRNVFHSIGVRSFLIVVSYVCSMCWMKRMPCLRFRLFNVLWHYECIEFYTNLSQGSLVAVTQLHTATTGYFFQSPRSRRNTSISCGWLRSSATKYTLQYIIEHFTFAYKHTTQHLWVFQFPLFNFAADCFLVVFRFIKWKHLILGRHTFRYTLFLSLFDGPFSAYFMLQTNKRGVGSGHAVYLGSNYKQRWRRLTATYAKIYI